MIQERSRAIHAPRFEDRVLGTVERTRPLNAEAAQVSNTQNALVPNTQNNEKRIPFLYKTGSDRANQSRGEESI